MKADTTVPKILEVLESNLPSYFGDKFRLEMACKIYNNIAEPTPNVGNLQSAAKAAQAKFTEENAKAQTKNANQQAQPITSSNCYEVLKQAQDIIAQQSEEAKKLTDQLNNQSQALSQQYYLLDQYRDLAESCDLKFNLTNNYADVLRNLSNHVLELRGRLNLINRDSKL